MQIDIINKMHQDIEQRVSAFKAKHPDATT
jgi:hypothetical protein